MNTLSEGHICFAQDGGREVEVFEGSHGNRGCSYFAPTANHIDHATGQRIEAELLCFSVDPERVIGMLAERDRVRERVANLFAVSPHSRAYQAVATALRIKEHEARDACRDLVRTRPDEFMAVGYGADNRGWGMVPR